MKLYKIFILLIFLTVSSFAETIDKVEINGNKRLSDESIFVFTNIEINKNYTSNDLNTVLKNLYKTNFFKNVTVRINNNTLFIDVVENYIVEDIIFNGIKNKKMLESLRDIVKLKSRSSYMESIFFNDVNTVKNFLKNSGYYFSDVQTSIELNDQNNTTNLIYNIDLGSRAKISKINFIGDKKVKDRKLSNIILSEEAHFWKFISKNIYLNKERIEFDKRLLTNYYKNNGYYNVKIEDSFLEFNENNSFKLVFNINAGKKYYFNKIELLLPDDYDQKDFLEITKLSKKLKNKKYSLNQIEKILDEIDSIAAFKKYEFLDAKLSEKIVDGNKLDFSINILETKKYYVEKINIIGNNFTIEEVIRNSLIVDEGDPYNKILFNKSLNILRSRNLFKDVNTKIIEGSEEQLKIIDIIVEEKPTGEVALGAGAGTSGATIGGGVTENNFLGKGIKVKTNFTISEDSLKGEFIYEKPNFNYTDNTLYTSFSNTTTDSIGDFGYKSKETSFSLGTRFEQYENLYFTPEIYNSYEKLETTASASANLKKQEGSYFDTYFNYTLDYDKRNQVYQTSDGSRYVFYQEVPVVSDNYELLNTFEISKYKTFTGEMIGKISFYAQNVLSLGDKDVRISKRIYVPGSKLRGFERGKVGPKDGSDYIGGNYATSINMSATLPQVLPSFQNTDISLFLDAANVWGVDYSSVIDDSNKIRSSTGLLLDIVTPVGPMNFSWALPITRLKGDRTETFRFNIGTTF
jgi:outer membrane protein insertion porin family